MILVTGAAGAIGRRLIRLLKELGAQLVAVDRRQMDTSEFAHIRCLQGDVTDELFLDTFPRTVTCVVHLAAQVRSCAGATCFINNVAASYQITRWSERCRLRRFIFASTVGVCDESGSSSYLTEDSPVCYTNTYTASKLVGEQLLRASSLPFTIMRFTHLYGATDDGLIYRVIQSAALSQEMRVREEYRDCLHIEDAVRAILAVINYKGPASLIQFGTGRLTSLSSIVAMASGNYRSVTVVPDEPVIHKPVDSTVAHSELGWYPTVDITDGVYNTVLQVLGRSALL
jgi:UDP-glucose 4-epimerase